MISIFSAIFAAALIVKKAFTEGLDEMGWPETDSAEGSEERARVHPRHGVFWNQQEYVEFEHPQMFVLNIRPSARSDLERWVRRVV